MTPTHLHLVNNLLGLLPHPHSECFLIANTKFTGTTIVPEKNSLVAKSWSGAPLHVKKKKVSAPSVHFTQIAIYTPYLRPFFSLKLACKVNHTLDKAERCFCIAMHIIGNVRIYVLCVRHPFHLRKGLHADEHTNTHVRENGRHSRSSQQCHAFPNLSSTTRLESKCTSSIDMNSFTQARWGW